MSSAVNKGKNQTNTCTICISNKINVSLMLSSVLLMDASINFAIGA